jgi:hypothetical protein
MNKPVVIVHPRPDLDACVCITLAGAAPQDVHFLPAGATEVPEVCPCCGKRLTGAERILDHPLGEKGRLDADGTRHSAAISMPESQKADPDLLAEVEEQDSTGLVRQPRFSLARILAAVRAEASERGLRGEQLDREVISVMSRIIRGLNLLHQAKESAREHITRARIVKIGGFKLALLPPGETPPQVGIILNEEFDVSGAIYQTGFNLGVTRYPGRDEPDLRKLQPHLPGWFVHTAGFLACWGNRKSPATSQSPEGTPQTREELLSLVRRVFER